MGAALVREHLPGHDVRVVLHLGDHDLVAGADVGAAPALRDQVDALGGATDEDELVRMLGANEAANPVPGRLVRTPRWMLAHSST